MWSWEGVDLTQGANGERRKKTSRVGENGRERDRRRYKSLRWSLKNSEDPKAGRTAKGEEASHKLPGEREKKLFEAGQTTKDGGIEEVTNRFKPLQA